MRVLNIGGDEGEHITSQSQNVKKLSAWFKKKVDPRE